MRALPLETPPYVDRTAPSSSKKVEFLVPLAQESTGTRPEVWDTFRALSAQVSFRTSSGRGVSMSEKTGTF